jgi:hypothetical protein
MQEENVKHYLCVSNHVIPKAVNPSSAANRQPVTNHSADFFQFIGGLEHRFGITMRLPFTADPPRQQANPIIPIR